MHKRDLVATGSWVLIGLATWIVAWIIAEAIPVFNNLLSLVVCFLAGWLLVKLMMLYRRRFLQAGLPVSSSLLS